jgi:atypical dual specificity phosphatase
MHKPPLPNTYWVTPDRILAGEHPCGDSVSESRARLGQLHDARIDYFVDLTEEGEMPDYRGLLPASSHYLRCAIPDTEVPREISEMQLLQSRLRTALALGRRIYVHCRAGIGRTGLVVGCHLVEQGLDGAAALERLNELWLASERAKSWPRVPQTDEQADFIRDWPRHRRPPKLGSPRLASRKPR